MQEDLTNIRYMAQEMRRTAKAPAKTAAAPAAKKIAK
jgi:hypothetical protein